METNPIIVVIVLVLLVGGVSWGVYEVSKDRTEVRDVASVAVSEDRTVCVRVLFDPDQGLSERIIVEQFTV